MRERCITRTGPALAALLLGVAPALIDARDLTRYRTFELGTDLPTVAKQTGMDVSRVKVVHTRPALIQELEWRPGYRGPDTEPDTVRDMVFTFIEGELYRIVVNYERHATEGMTVDDLTEAISATYGTAVKPAQPSTPIGGYGGSEESVAQWQDALHRYDLIRSAYGPSYRLVGTLKRLETLAEAAIAKATRLDDEEAPQREAAQLAREEDAAASRLEKARLANKPKFRP